MDEIKTYNVFSKFFQQSCRLWDNAEKYSTDEQVKDDNMAHAHFTLGI